MWHGQGQRKSFITSCFESEMNIPGNNLARIKRIIESTGKPQTLTETALDRLVSVPRQVDRLKSALFAMNGNRPEETQQEVIDFHCQILGLTYWKTFDSATIEHLHHFKLKEFQ